MIFKFKVRVLKLPQEIRSTINFEIGLRILEKRITTIE
jgi:hypothetical protein